MISFRLIVLHSNGSFAPMGPWSFPYDVPDMENIPPALDALGQQLTTWVEAMARVPGVAGVAAWTSFRNRWTLIHGQEWTKVGQAPDNPGWPPPMPAGWPAWLPWPPLVPGLPGIPTQPARGFFR